MPTELDHIFICRSRDAADSLAAFGLTEGTSNVHLGQGTACRRFVFRNAFLERLWVRSPAETRSETTRPTRLWERWKDKDEGTCSFGIGFQPGSDENHGFRESQAWSWFSSHAEELHKSFRNTPYGVSAQAPQSELIARMENVITTSLVGRAHFAKRDGKSEFDGSEKEAGKASLEPALGYDGPMPPKPDPPSHGSLGPDPVVFTTTHWSVVLVAGNSSVRDAHAALETLCRAY